jgi:hypothetical protein
MRSYIKNIYAILYRRVQAIYQAKKPFMQKILSGIFPFFEKYGVKKRLGILFTATLPFYVWMGSSLFFASAPIGGGEVVCVEDTSKQLSAEEKAIYTNLGPIYQKIYLFALNSEERGRVALYVRRGQTAYEAIDVILRSEERKYLRQHPKKTYQSPAEKATAKNAKSYSVF